MDNEIIVWLYDISNSIIEIETFLIDTNNEFKKFKKDLRTKRAIERNIEIIGEAVNRITKKDKTISLTNAKKIIDTRNRIIHGYDSVSDDMIWSIVIKHIPILKSEIQEILNENNLE